VPIFLRVTVYRSKFTPGPFYLGAASLPVSIVALLWAVFAIVLFALPQVYDVTAANLNYAPIAGEAWRPAAAPRSRLSLTCVNALRFGCTKRYGIA
jgi:hypothetical protein